MVKLPSTPQDWNDQPEPPQGILGAASPDNPPQRPGGIFSDFKPAEWSPANSGLNMLFHPDTLADMGLAHPEPGPHMVQAVSGQSPAGANAAQARHWSRKDKSVNVSDEMGAVADAVARDFNTQTGRDLVVTSGFRTPAEQANEMYKKFLEKKGGIYKGPSGGEIRDIYNKGVAAGQSKEEILQNMAGAIQSQMDAGHPVSRHLDDHGLDFRSRDLNARDHAILQDAIRRNGTLLIEGNHFHGSFPRAQRPKP